MQKEFTKEFNFSIIKTRENEGYFPQIITKNSIINYVIVESFEKAESMLLDELLKSEIC